MAKTRPNGRHTGAGKKAATVRANRARRGKGEDMTGAKESAVEVRKTGELDLQPIVIDDADFDLHLRSLKSAVERQKAATNLYDGVCKAAKKVSEELLTAIKRAVKFEGMDVADIKRQMEIDGYVLRKTGSSVQLTIHDTLLGDAKEAAYSRGMNAGQNGQTLNNPYPKNSDLAEEFAAGWRNGMAKNVTGAEQAPRDGAASSADPPQEESPPLAAE